MQELPASYTHTSVWSSTRAASLTPPRGWVRHLLRAGVRDVGMSAMRGAVAVVMTVRRVGS
jgi:hypothetical protein